MRGGALTIEDVLSATRAVAQIARTTGDAMRAARTLRDEAREARRHLAAAGSAHPRYGDGTLASAARRAARTAPAADPTLRELLAAGAAVCATLAGAQVDQSAWRLQSEASGAEAPPQVRPIGRDSDPLPKG